MYSQKNGVSDYRLSDQALEPRNVCEEARNNQLFGVLHGSTKIALSPGDEGRIVSTSVARRELPSDNMVSVADNRVFRKSSLEASGLRTKDG